MTSSDQRDSSSPLYRYRDPILLTAAEYAAARGPELRADVSPNPAKVHYLRVGGQVYMFALSRKGSSYGVMVYESPLDAIPAQWKSHGHYILPLQDCKEIRLFGNLLVVTGVARSGNHSETKVYAALILNNGQLGQFTLQTPITAPEQAQYVMSEYHRQGNYFIRKDFIDLSKTSDHIKELPVMYYVDDCLANAEIAASENQQPLENAVQPTSVQDLSQDYEELLTRVKAVVSGIISGTSKPKQDKAIAELVTVYVRQTLARGHVPQKWSTTLT